MLSLFSHVQLFATLWTVVHQAPLSWDSLDKNTGVDGHSLFQGIFPNLGLLHCRQILYLLSPQGRPWVSVCPFLKQDSWIASASLKVNMCTSHLGILLKCKLLFSRLGVGPETLHI